MRHRPRLHDPGYGGSGEGTDRVAEGSKLSARRGVHNSRLCSPDALSTYEGVGLPDSLGACDPAGCGEHFTDPLHPILTQNPEPIT